MDYGIVFPQEPQLRAAPFEPLEVRHRRLGRSQRRAHRPNCFERRFAAPLVRVPASQGDERFREHHDPASREGDMSNDFRGRFGRLSDEELFNIVNISFADYREEALEAAKTELARRGFQLARTGMDFEVITPTGVRLTAPKLAPTSESHEVVEEPCLPTRWLRFYIYLRLFQSGFPIFLFIIMGSSGIGLTEGIVIAMIAIPFSLVAVVAFGLGRRKLWAWQANWILMALDVLGFKFFITPIDAMLVAVIALGLVWFWPNYVYFKKRRALFS